MKKVNEIDEVDEILPEYDFSKGVRGKYAERYAKGTKVVVTSHKRSTESYSIVGHSIRVTGRGANSRISSKSSVYGRATMARNEKTSKAVGTKASKLLRSKSTSKAVKSVAASALTQRPDRKKKKK